MKKFLIFSILTMFLSGSLCSQEDFRKGAPKPGPAPRIELGKAETFTLKNGLKVIVVEHHKLPQVSVQLFVDVPPFVEGEAAGYADIAGQMLTKGTQTRTKAQIDETVDYIGASLSSSASGINGACLSKHKEVLLGLMSDVLLNPVFPEAEFDKIKKQTLSALAQAKDDPNEIASNVASVLKYGANHPYGEIQTEKTIERITVDLCKSFYQTYFKPGISYLVITGDVTLKDVKKLAAKYFDAWQNAPVKKETYSPPVQPASSLVRFVDKAGAVQSVVNITYPVDLKPGAPDAIKASVMNTLLGGYFSSRLNANLREDKGYTYGARSSLSNDPVVGSFTAFASVRNEVTDSSLAQFLLEINKLRSEKPAAKELDMVKNVMTGNFARSLEDPGTVAQFTLNTARYGLPADYYATYLEKLSSVNADDVLAMAKRYLTPEHAHLLVVGNKDEVAEKLKPFSYDQKLYFYDVYGIPVQENALSVPAGVTAESVLKKYLDALAKPEVLANIKTFKMVMEAEVQGMAITNTMTQKAPGKLLFSVSMMGSEMQKMVFDGQKGYQSQMGAKTAMEGTELEDYKVDANLFPERFYGQFGVKTSLKGAESINGKTAYKLLVEYPSGTKKTHFFDAESGLKVREIESKGEAAITSEYGDYKEVNGVKFYHSVTILGAAPFPLNMSVKSVELNPQVSDDVFKVE